VIYQLGQGFQQLGQELKQLGQGFKQKHVFKKPGLVEPGQDAKN